MKAPQPPPAHVTTGAPEKRWVLLAEINRHLVCNSKPVVKTFDRPKQKKRLELYNQLRYWEHTANVIRQIIKPRKIKTLKMNPNFRNHRRERNPNFRDQKGKVTSQSKSRTWRKRIRNIDWFRTRWEENIWRGGGDDRRKGEASERERVKESGVKEKP